MTTVYTIGHSTRTLEELVAALKAHNISTLVDIRAFPMSRRLPHFNRESLEQELPKRGIGYVWMKGLGGRRKKTLDDSPNTGLRNDSFRNYADYMLTAEFAQEIERLLRIAEEPTLPATTAEDRAASVAASDETAKRSLAQGMTSEKKVGAGTAIMCAERVYFQCHRMLVSDYLTAKGCRILHIDDAKRPVREHKMMPEAQVVDGKLVYNGQRLF